MDEKTALKGKRRGKIVRSKRETKNAFLGEKKLMGF